MPASSEVSGKRSLEHPFHEHDLTLREISKDSCADVCCYLCRQRIKGPMYCCEDCDFILHQVCEQMEFPALIQEHPSHKHPLELDPHRGCYWCNDCGFSLDALTAIATLLPPEEADEETIQHFSHEAHPLSSFRVETPIPAHCNLCEKQIFAGQVYGCRSCLFFLDKACALLTLELHRPLHPQHPLTLFVPSPSQSFCFACGSYIKSMPSYCCQECHFTLHLGCANTMDSRYYGMKDREEEEEESSCAIKHFSHEHLLKPVHGRVPSSHSKCNVCMLNASGAEALACSNSCRFILHKSCAEKLPKEMPHPIHSQHSHLILQQEDNYKCDSCLEDRSFIAFSCQDCSFKLDPACAFQTLSAVEDGAAPSISHFAHEHPLELAFVFPDKRTCAACKQYIDGVAYRCFLCYPFWLHRSCAELQPKLQHAFHPQHPLILSETPGFYFVCFACHKKHVGLAFYCAECEFYIGVGCASLNPTLKHPLHEHCLAYCEGNDTKQLQCSRCGKRCRYEFYCCMRCNFSLHSDCLHLPSTMNHKSHWHLLQLCDKVVNGNPDDLYCDYCETSRDPDHGVYHCKECDFSAHIECIIYDYKGEVKGSETWGSDLSNQLNIEIASLKGKIEITRRDLEAMGANLELSVDELAEIERKWKL